MSRRLLVGVIAAVAALAAAAAPAGASSLTYVKDGNVWLTDPGGAKQYQVTFDGGYSSPSQADDGTIVALQNRRFVRMDRSGRQLNAPVDGIGTDPNGGEFYGPYEPKVSPDGRRIAYWFGQYEQRYDYGCSCYLWTTENYVTWTWADHFKPYTDDGQDKGTVAPSWLTNDRLLATYPGFYQNGLDLEARQRARQLRRAMVVLDPEPGRRLLRLRRRRGQPRRLALRGHRGRRRDVRRPALHRHHQRPAVGR